MTAQTPASAEMEKWCRIRVRFSQTFDSGYGSGSERKMKNPARVDSGIPDPVPRLLSTRCVNCAPEMAGNLRLSDRVFLLSDPILFLKNDIRFRSESCFGWNHTIRIRKQSESVLWCTTYIFALCLFCLIAFSWTRLVEVSHDKFETPVLLCWTWHL